MANISTAWPACKTGLLCPTTEKKQRQQQQQQEPQQQQQQQHGSETCHIKSNHVYSAFLPAL